MTEAEILQVQAPQTLVVCGKELVLREWTRAEQAYYQSLSKDLGIVDRVERLNQIRNDRALEKAKQKQIQVKEKLLERKIAQYDALLAKLADLDATVTEEDEEKLTRLGLEIDQAQEELATLTEPITGEIEQLLRGAGEQTDEIMALMDKANLSMCYALAEDVPNRLATAPSDKERKEIKAYLSNPELERWFEQATASDIDNAEKIVEEGTKFFTSRLNRKMRRQQAKTLN